MSAPIGRGDWVERFGGDNIKSPLHPPARVEGRPMKRGGLYCVREVFQGHYADGSVGYGLKFEGTRGFNSAGREGGWPVEMFRPIYRPDETLTQRLMEPLPDAIAPSPEPVSEPQPRDPQVVRAWSRESQQ